MSNRWTAADLTKLQLSKSRLVSPLGIENGRMGQGVINPQKARHGDPRGSQGGVRGKDQAPRKPGSGLYQRGWAIYLPASPVKEYRFAAPRKWKFDYAYPEFMVAIEIEGGVWIQGRHIRGKGFLLDMEKYNEAALLGWKVFRFTPAQVKARIAAQFLERLDVFKKLSG